MEMDYELSNKVINKARNRIFEDKTYTLWLTELQSMDKESYVDFDTYLKNMKSKQLSYKSNNVKKESKSIEELRCEATIIMQADNENNLIIEKESL
jgi:selenophosphate synthetase-related protein